MGKSKYRFNTESLNYDKVRPSLRKRLLILVSYLSILAVIAILLNVFYSSVFDNPREKALKMENTADLCFKYMVENFLTNTY